MKAKSISYFSLVLLFIFNSFLHPVIAQPPAQGPPPLPGTTTNELGNYIVIDLVKTTIQRNVDTINARIDRQSEASGVKANLGFTVKIFKPGMSVTTLKDQPNQNVVRFAFMIEYNVTGISYKGIPYFSRKINQSIDVIVSCKNWFAPPGNIHIAASIEKPFLDNAVFGEQVLDFFITKTLTDFVDNEIRQLLPDAFSTFINVKNTPCSCLGIESGDLPDYRNGSIKFAYKKRLIVDGGGTTTGANSVTITLKSIKRLAARSIDGQILYTPLENIQIELYGNQTLRTASVNQINEGEERVLNIQEISIGRPADDGTVVLIANIAQLPAFTKDTRFVVFGINTNFGNGIQKLVIQKSYWEKSQGLPNDKKSKPVERKMNAYELTVQVNTRTNSVQPGKGAGPKYPGNNKKGN